MWTVFIDRGGWGQSLQLKKARPTPQSLFYEGKIKKKKPNRENPLE